MSEVPLYSLCGTAPSPLGRTRAFTHQIGEYRLKQSNKSRKSALDQARHGLAVVDATDGWGFGDDSQVDVLASVKSVNIRPGNGAGPGPTEQARNGLAVVDPTC